MQNPHLWTNNARHELLTFCHGLDIAFTNFTTGRHVKNMQVNIFQIIYNTKNLSKTGLYKYIYTPRLLHQYVL